ncbi:MAG: hypothetical protein LAT82_00605 [Nanoarchaeota archaeon]|nr:hypothetical protein [Nanoarchaeota archaeon]
MSSKKISFDPNGVRLIQRLVEPSYHSDSTAWSRVRGLTREQKEAISDVFAFDYMGNSEFEFGEPKKALNDIAKYSNNSKGRTGLIEISNTPLFYLCHRGVEEIVENTIQRFSNNDRTGLAEPLYLREKLGLEESFHPEIDRLSGWLDCGNNWAFFANEKMFQRFKKLFPRL